MRSFDSSQSKQNPAGESGQAIVLLVLLITGLIAIAALAVDGGRLYAERRFVQNASDNAALAGALAICTGESVISAAQGAAAANGNGEFLDVVVNQPPSSGPNAGDNAYVEVIIRSARQPFFAQLVYSGELEATARAVAHCYTVPVGEFALLATSQTCGNAIDWSGSDVTIDGDVHSNNDFKVAGSDNLVIGDVTYVSTVDADPSHISYIPPPPDNPTQTSVQFPPVDFNISDYAPGGAQAIAAQSAGQYYSTTAKIDLGWLTSQGLYNDSTKVVQDGLYYTTDQIDIGISDLIGNNVTFVANGTIAFAGSNQALAPYVDELLAFSDLQYSGGAECNSFVIKFSGSGNSWTGIVFAPNGLVDMSGSTTTSSNGSLIGYTIKISGSDLSISYTDGLFPPASFIELSE